MAQLEHVNITVKDAAATAAWMQEVFGWYIRWEGEVLGGAGYSIHAGTKESYVALYTPKAIKSTADNSYLTSGGLNHIAVTVDDIAETEKNVVQAGFTPEKHGDYEPGLRFYFSDTNGVEYEVVQYT